MKFSLAFAYLLSVPAAAFSPAAVSFSRSETVSAVEKGFPCNTVPAGRRATSYLVFISHLAVICV